MSLHWSWILLAWLVGIGFLVSEVLVTGIVMGVLGLLLIVAATAAMFVTEGPLAGLGMGAGSLVLGLLVLRVGAQGLTHDHQLSDETGFVGTDDYSDLVGERGEAATDLRPGGFATINGRRVDVVTRGDMIDKGTSVAVTEVEGNTVVVKKAW